MEKITVGRKGEKREGKEKRRRKIWKRRRYAWKLACPEEEKAAIKS